MCWSFWVNTMSVLDDKRPGARREDLECTIHPFGTLKDPMFVVVVSRYDGKYLLSRHSKRETWETQGGHIESGETPYQAACRELIEESGAQDFVLYPVCDYHGYNNFGSADGCVFRAEITALGSLPESEMAEVRLFDVLPENLTYPKVTPKLFDEAFAKRSER